METPLLVNATEPVGTATPPVSSRALNVVLPPNVMGLALDESSVIVGAWLIVSVTGPQDEGL
jgi:hypothetical protein